MPLTIVGRAGEMYEALHHQFEMNEDLSAKFGYTVINFNFDGQTKTAKVDENTLKLTDRESLMIVGEAADHHTC